MSAPGITWVPVGSLLQELLRVHVLMWGFLSDGKSSSSEQRSFQLGQRKGTDVESVSTHLRVNGQALCVG